MHNAHSAVKSFVELAVFLCFMDSWAEKKQVPAGNFVFQIVQV